MIYHSKLPKWLWLICAACLHQWDAEFIIDHGGLEAVDSRGEECPECGSNEIEEAE